LTVFGLQRVAALAALPFYILLFPFGAIVHCIFGGIALGHALNTFDDRAWQNFFERLFPYPGQLRLKVAGVALAVWLLTPTVLCAGLHELSPDVSLALAVKIKELLGYSLFPSSLPQYQDAFANRIGPVAASHYVIGMFTLAVVPVLIAVFIPGFLVVCALSGLRMRLQKSPAAKIGIMYWFMLLMMLLGVATFYLFSFKFSYDAGRIHPYRSFVSLPVCFWPIHFGGFILLTMLVHTGVCAVLVRRRLPVPVEMRLDQWETSGSVG
jgi:hypothetical protein